MKSLKLIPAILVAVLVIRSPYAGATATPSAGQRPALPPQHIQPYGLDTGRHSGAGGEKDLVAFSEVVQAPGAAWMRLHFDGYALGDQSYITLTSLLDGDQQRLDARSLPQWNNASAFFNGDAVRLDLHVAAGDRDVFVRLAELTVGEPGRIEQASAELAPESLCGGDNRVASTEARVARLWPVGCTAWLVSNGQVLTAGHCVDLDPDRGGPMLPDGVLDLSGVLQFNVPASLADGTPVMSAADDQYPVNTTNVAWRFDGEGQGLGKDWAVFRVNANSNTGRRAHNVQGFFRMTNIAPINNTILRITGFGLDSTPAGTTGGGNAQSQTNQTSTGPYDGETTSGADIWHTYRVDTMGGNSGGPIIWENTGYSIGIHTNSGCDDDGNGNTGTSFEVDALENAIHNAVGANVRYVDHTQFNWVETGRIFEPFDRISEGVGAVPGGGILSIVAGTYDESLTIDKNLTITVPVGTVTIGQ